MLNADDPLVPVPVRAEDYVHQALMEHPGADVVELISRFHTEFAVRMAGFDSVGNPIPPPDSHVLDHLARAWDLTDDEGAGDRPAAGTVVCPIEELECELCGARARYESPLMVRGERVRVELCLECMREHGDPVLGGSGSVYFMYFDEVSAAVRAVCDEICTRKGRASIWGGPTDCAGRYRWRLLTDATSGRTGLRRTAPRCRGGGGSTSPPLARRVRTRVRRARP